MLANQNNPRGEQFRDGVMTKRGTFQKYYTQAEIKAFLERALDEEAIPTAPGVLYIFRDKDLEQRFLADRCRSRRNTLRAPSPRQWECIAQPHRDRTTEKYETWREPLERLWDLWLTLGRKPDKSEAHDLTALSEGFGSLNKALHFIAARKDPAAIERAAAARTTDLVVYFALNRFERRRPYKQLERGLQRDVKHFFGDYHAAQTAGLNLLLQIADVAAIEQACRLAAERGLGWLEPGKSLQLHTSLVEQLPPLLQIYVGCAAVLYGDYRYADLVKIHIGSGKVSLMRYDDFAGKPLPRLIERVKIKLREQDIDYFAYGDHYEPPFLFHKSRYINEEFPHYPEQMAFEEALDRLGLFDFSGYGPEPGAFLATLSRHRWTVAGFDLVRSNTSPNLDDPCGQYLTFRQLIECGETQADTRLANLPKRPESYNALHDLAINILDPVIDYFGMIRLTYGFCSPELARKIPGRIDPARDQHAAHELNRHGRPLCERLGAAADFILEDESMLEVARWIVVNTPFDRLYFYGDDKPIHVSYGPNPARQVVRMVAGRSGRLIPRVLLVTEFTSRP
jgi:DNA phosphorothioation-associated putative methyltransferase